MQDCQLASDQDQETVEMCHLIDKTPSLWIQQFLYSEAYLSTNYGYKVAELLSESLRNVLSFKVTQK